NLHPTCLTNERDEEEMARVDEAFAEIFQAAISMGGTITGEHGVGRLKKAWLPDQVGPDVMDLTRRIKAALDPDSILNPGVIL
ncbi:MAG: FAD-binding oxidoreductase, partial [Rhodococcus ruber]|nr:FAD-binding oxidoreductase [Rhodococcus ruber]